MNDVRCPYCNEYNEINHDDGYGYEEERLHQQECSECNKTFTYTTWIHFSYEAYKADCLNGGEHEFEKTITYPVCGTRLQCTICEETKSIPIDELCPDRDQCVIECPLMRKE